LDDERHRLVLTLHHIITDGWSNDILVRDLAELYDAEVCSRPATLRELEIQYVDYSEWQREQSESGGWDDDLAYWTGQFGGAPDALEVVTDFPRRPTGGYAGAFTSLRLDPDLERDLDAVCRREGTTLFMAVLAAFSAVLRVYTGHDDVVVG